MVPSGQTIGAAEILGLTSDSRQVKAGYLFAALPGTVTDGRCFIGDAVDRGAAAVLTKLGTPLQFLPPSTIALTDENPRLAFARLAARFYALQPNHVAAVTGTNGKSSVAEFTRQLWSAQNLSAASLGTLGIVSSARTEPGSLTTPDSAILHAELRDLADDGVGHLILEASSHGLHQFRLDGVTVVTGAFTNLSRDHLDYHRDMAAYLKAKLALFDRVMAPGGTAVINADDPAAAAVEKIALKQNHRLIRYGANGAEIKLQVLEPVSNGQELTFTLFGETVESWLPLVGEFQAANALCALGISLASLGSEISVAAALAGLRGVRGRLEHIATASSGAPIYVDYAHTAVALEAVLKALRPHTRNRLIVVFGCGGDRDVGKRGPMGAVATAHADKAIITDDNPRTEDAADIRRQILAACPVGLEVGDRRAAIVAAIETSIDGDVVLVAGKGHEHGQIIGDEVIPFEDAAVVRSLVAGGAV